MPDTRRKIDAATPLPRPVAGRLQRPSWRDGRLVAGVVLVLLATIVGAAVMRHYDDSVEVLQARHALVPGQRITADDVHAVKVRIDDSSTTYLSATGSLPRGEVLRECAPVSCCRARRSANPRRCG